MEYRVGTKVFNDWEIVRVIGEGASGKVYEIQKNDFGVTSRSALKVVRIPKSISDIRAAFAEGMDEKSVTAYFQGYVHEIVKEVAIMSELKSHTNIVSYEDHCILPHEGEIGWDILIRMELLVPISDYLMSHKLTENEIIRLGREMCSALVFCQKKGLIHRDIKPENIFANEIGQFKLGDFGIARTVEKTTGGLSKKGTESYMAPEVYLGKPYGASVDIYSVGLVLYKLANNNRLPFFPPAPLPIRFEDRENALSLRMSGKEKIQPPVNACEEFAEVILNACAYKSEERYQTAAEMLAALNNIKKTNGSETDCPPPSAYEAGPTVLGDYPEQPYEAGPTVLGDYPEQPYEAGPTVLGDYSEQLYEAGPTVLGDYPKQPYEVDPKVVGEPPKYSEEFAPAAPEKPKGKKPVIIAAIVGLVVVLGAAGAVIGSKVIDQKTENTAQNEIHNTVEEVEKNVERNVEENTEKEDEEEITVKEVSVGCQTQMVLVGDSVDLWLKTDSLYIDRRSEGLGWDSDNESVATVKDGVLTAHSAGTVKITGTYQGVDGFMQMTVVEEDAQSGVFIDADYESISLEEGSSAQVTFSLSGNLESKIGAICYASEDLDVSFEWGSGTKNKIPLTISALIASENQTGDVTVLVYPADDPERIIAVGKVHVNIN